MQGPKDGTPGDPGGSSKLLRYYFPVRDAAAEGFFSPGAQARQRANVAQDPRRMTAPPYLEPDPSTHSIHAESSAVVHGSPSQADARFTLPKIRLSGGAPGARATEKTYVLRPSRGSAVGVPEMAYFDVVPQWDPDADDLDTSALSPHLRFMRLKVAKVAGPSTPGAASPEPGDEGSGLRHSLKATVPFTMRNPSTVGPADVSVEDPVSLSDLATFVSNIKPRSVMDLKPLLLLCQGLLTKIIGHQLRTYNADNVILRAELEGLRERVHETFEKLQSTSALVEQLQNRNRELESKSHHEQELHSAVGDQADRTASGEAAQGRGRPKSSKDKEAGADRSKSTKMPEPVQRAGSGPGSGKVADMGRQPSHNASAGAEGGAAGVGRAASGAAAAAGDGGAGEESAAARAAPSEAARSADAASAQKPASEAEAADGGGEEAPASRGDVSGGAVPEGSRGVAKEVAFRTAPIVEPRSRPSSQTGAAGLGRKSGGWESRSGALGGDGEGSEGAPSVGEASLGLRSISSGLGVLKPQSKSNKELSLRSGRSAGRGSVWRSGDSGALGSDGLSEADAYDEDELNARLRMDMQDLISNVQSLEGRLVRRQPSHKGISVHRVMQSEELKDALARIKHLSTQLRQEKKAVEEMAQAKANMEARVAAAEKLRELKAREAEEFDAQRKALKARLRELEHLNEQLQKLASQSDVSVSHALKRLSEEELAAWVKEFDPTSFDFDYSELSLKNMRDLLAILGPGTACHIVAQSNPGDACRLLLSIDVNVFEEIVSSLNVEAIASFFLVKDKQLFSLLDHRLAQSQTSSSVGVLQAVAVAVNAAELAEQVARGKNLKDLRRWLPGSTGGVPHAPLFTIAAWKGGQFYAIHSAAKGTDPPIVAQLLQPLPASLRSAVLARVEDAEAVEVLKHMDEQLVGHTLVEMEEARVHAVVRGLAESDESNLQKVFAACAEYQHARKGLYRATHHKILGQLTKIFDTKPPATSEGVKAKVELPAVMATMTASEASLETQYRAALDDMGSANEMAVWMLENGPVASVLAIRNCRTQTMVASALMSLPETLLLQMLSFFRLSDVTFAREWPIDRAVWVMRQMKPARVGSLLAEMHNLIGPNWTSQILMTLHRSDAPTRFVEEVDMAMRLWIAARDVAQACEAIVDTGKHNRILRDLDAEAALRARVSLTDLNKRMSVQESLQKFLAAVGKKKTNRRVDPKAEKDMTPEEATQMMLRDLVTSGEIAEAVRVAEEIEFRVTKLAKESQVSVPERIIVRKSSSHSNSQVGDTTPSSRSGAPSPVPMSSATPGQGMPLPRPSKASSGGKGRPPLAKVTSMAIRTGPDRAMRRAISEREMRDPQEMVQEHVVKMCSALVQMDPEMAAEFVVSLARKRPDLAALTLTRLPSEFQGRVYGWIGARSSVLSRFVRDTAEDSALTATEQLIAATSQATSPQLLLEHLDAVARQMLRDFSVRLTVLELPVDGATTTKLRGELVPSKPPPEVIKLTQRLGLAAVNPADVVQVAPEVDVMYTGELLPVSTKRARELNAALTPAEELPGDFDTSFGNRSRWNRKQARQRSSASLGSLADASTQGTKTPGPPPTPPNKDGSGFGGAVAQAVAQARQSGGEGGGGGGGGGGMSVARLHELTVLYGAMMRMQHVPRVFKTMAKRIESDEFVGLAVRHGVSIAPIWRHRPGTAKHATDGLQILGGVVATADEGRDPCELCACQKRADHYPELDPEPHVDWRVGALLQQLAQELSTWVQQRGRRTEDMVRVEKELQESPDGLVTLRDDLPGNRALYGTLSKLVVFQVRALQDLQKQLMEIKSYREPTEKVTRILAAMHCLIFAGDVRALGQLDLTDGSGREKAWSLIKSKLAFESSEPRNALVLMSECSNDVKLGAPVTAIKPSQLSTALALLSGVSHAEAQKSSPTLASIRQWVMIVINGARVAEHLDSLANAKDRVLASGWLQKSNSKDSIAPVSVAP